MNVPGIQNLDLGNLKQGVLLHIDACHRFVPFFVIVVVTTLPGYVLDDRDRSGPIEVAKPNHLATFGADIGTAG